VTQSKIVENIEELHKLINAPNIEIISVIDSLGDKLLVLFRENAVDMTDSPNKNVVLSAQTTAIGRVLLYKLLTTAGKNTNYCDTGIYL
jgi:hypothetical protein